MVNTWTTTHHIEEQEISVRTPGGVGQNLWQIEGTLTITWVRDRNADCDADGNRGHDVTYEDERTFVLTSAARCGADGEWEPNADPIPDYVVKAAADWAETCEPPDYGEEPEEDCDDIGD